MSARVSRFAPAKITPTTRAAHMLLCRWGLRERQGVREGADEKEREKERKFKKMKRARKNVSAREKRKSNRVENDRA